MNDFKTKKYVLSDGRIAFVRSGIGPDAFKAFAKVPNPKKKEGFDTPHGIRTLQWRGTFEEAQDDLDKAMEEQKGIFNKAMILDIARYSDGGIKNLS